MSEQPQATPPNILTYLQIVNRLVLKSSATNNKEALIFHIVNDTFHVSPYDRAYLFSFENKKSRLIGISGQTEVNRTTALTQSLETLTNALKKPGELTAVNSESFSEAEVNTWNEMQKGTPSSVFWIPIFFEDKLILGLWLEQWSTPTFKLPHKDMPILLKQYLMPAYGISWDRINQKKSFRKIFQISRRNVFIFSTALFLALLIIRVPLRIAAPCEIVPKNPLLIRAPLEGVIKEVEVKPGQWVKKGQLLFQYEKEPVEEAVKSAEQNLLKKEYELKRAKILGMKDKKSLEELSVINIEKEKAAIELDFEKYKASLLAVDAPEEGMIILDSPESWRGRPVKIGEKVLEVSNPKKTSIKIWIPESDNVPLDDKIPIKVFLNTDPGTSFPAKIEYIGNETVLSDLEIPSYAAKANWIDQQPKDVKIGVRGTAILYGENVSLFYYLTRKPWYALREYLKF